MALVLDPRTGQYVNVPDNSAAARLQAAAQQPVQTPTGALPPLQGPTPPGAQPLLTPEQAFAQGRQLTPPAGVNPDVPTVPGQTWPLQPLPLSPGVVPDTQQPVTGVRTAADLAGTNRLIADAITASRPQAGILQPAERGNFNMYNTNVAALPKPVGGGLNFGFGVNGNQTAGQYLQDMRAVDTQAASDARQEALFRDLQYAQSSITPNSSIGEIAAARARIAAIQPALTGQTAASTRLAEAGIQARTAQNQLENNLAVAGVKGQSDYATQLAAANLTGQYAVAAATAKGQATLDKVKLEALSPAGQKAAMEAALLETQLNAIRAGVGAGQLNNAQVIAATRAGQERAPIPATDPITGVPYTPEEIALIQRMRLAQQQAQQTQR